MTSPRKQWVLLQTVNKEKDAEVAFIALADGCHLRRSGEFRPGGHIY